EREEPAACSDVVSELIQLILGERGLVERQDDAAIAREIVRQGRLLDDLASGGLAEFAIAEVDRVIAGIDQHRIRQRLATEVGHELAVIPDIVVTTSFREGTGIAGEDEEPVSD